MKRTSDPSELTTAALHREISVVQDKLEAAIATRRDLTHTMFDAVYQRFDLVEKSRVELKSDTKQAVDAALAAAKEAVTLQTTASQLAINKSESSTVDQLKQLTTTFETRISGVTDLLNDTKDRVAKIESMRVGAESSTSNKRADSAIFLAITSVLVAAIAIVAPFLLK